MLVEQGEYFRTVDVKECFVITNEETGLKEIVAISFYTTEKELKKTSEIRFVNRFGPGKDETESYWCKEMGDEYIMRDPETEDNSVRYIISRRPREIIMVVDEENKDKKKMISDVRPVIFMPKKETFEVMEKFYHLVRNGITTPVVTNMRQPLILAGQLFTNKETAENILKYLDGDTSISVPSKLLTRAKYLIKVYETWVTEIYKEMKSRDMIQPTEVIVSSSGKIPHLIHIDEKEIEPMISEMVREGRLYFTKQKTHDVVEDFNDYMGKMARMMTTRIESIAKPIHQTGDIRSKTTDILNSLQRKPKRAQTDAVEAMLKALDLRGKVSIIGEMGTGKTYMMTATQKVHAQYLGKTLKMLVLAPDHLTKTVWKEEIEKVSDDITVHQIRSVNDLMYFDKMGYLNDNQERAFILSQTSSKVGYFFKPALQWSKRKQAFSCPVCGKDVEKKKKFTDPITEVSTYMMVPVSFAHFSSNGPTTNNHKCKKCETTLWEPVTKNTNKNSKFIYSSELKGYYPRDTEPVREKINDLRYSQAEATGEKDRRKYDKEIAKYRSLEMLIQGKQKEKPRRSKSAAPVADFIFKKMQNRFTHLVIDEFHEFQGDSLRTNACEKLFHSVPYVTTGTGTGMNGYADSRFRTDFMMQPDKMKKAGYTINDADKYQIDYGVVQKKYRLIETNGKIKKEHLAPSKKPGISPVIFPLFMQDTTVFVNMEDLEDDMPKLEHVQIPVTMDPELKQAQKKLVEEIRSATRNDKKMFKSTFQLNYSYLDAPQEEKELRDKDTGEVIVKTPVISSFHDNKLQELIKVAHSEVIHQKNRMMIYTHFSGDRINDYLAKHLMLEGFKVTILSPVNQKSISCDGTLQKVDKEEREMFLREEVLKGTEILLVNPELVKTGCNLIDYNTILYYQMGYQVYTNRQADRRAWRLGQTKDCKVIYMYYQDTIQENVASLMATKIVASRSIEGKMDADGLEALCSDRTAEEELSAKFYEGIKDTVKINRYTI